MQTKLMSEIMSLSELSMEIFLCFMDLQNERNIFFTNIYNIIRIKGVSFVLIIVSVWALKSPTSQKSRNLRIGTVRPRIDKIIQIFLYYFSPQTKVYPLFKDPGRQLRFTLSLVW